MAKLTWPGRNPLYPGESPFDEDDYPEIVPVVEPDAGKDDKEEDDVEEGTQQRRR